MDRLWDTSSVVKLLRQGVEKGYWTIDDLDHPSEGWAWNERHFRLHHPKYQQREWRNLLRETTALEAVEPIAPRDLAAPLPPSASQQQPQLPHQWPPDLDPTPEPPLF